MAASGGNPRVLEKFEIFTKSPEKFLESQEPLAVEFKSLTKYLYDETKALESDFLESINKTRGLSQLIIKNFDDEQIWQELELQNNSVVKDFVKTISEAVASKKLSLGCNSVVEEEDDVHDDQDEEVDDVHGDQDVQEDDDRDLQDAAGDDSDDWPMDDEKEDEIERETDEDSERDLGDGTLRLSEEDDSSDDETEVEISKPEKKTVRFSLPTKPSVVDDQFFKLNDLEDFLKQADANEGRNDAADEDDDSIDYFEEIASDDDENEKGAAANYEDFFDPPEGEENDNISSEELEEKHLTENDLDSRDVDEEDMPRDGPPKRILDLDEDDYDDGETVEDILGSGRKSSTSAFEQQQKKMGKRIQELEEENLGEKSWQLRGEISADNRPENSLLEEHLQFDHMTRPAPVNTEETTKTLEDIIIQRIKDKAWDDVERKVKPNEQPFEYRRRVVLDSEKSKESLASVYEKEYLKQQQKEEEEKEVPEHTEIKKMMDSLFAKLDSLANFHYTPKMPVPEIKIINNLPAITVEEVVPVGTSDAAMLAPEEVKTKLNWELRGSSERSGTDKNRERRAKKSVQRKKKREKEARTKLVERLKPGLGNKYSKMDALKKLERSSNADIIKDDKSNKKNMTSSKDFFARLQDQVTSQVKSQAPTVKKKKKREKELSSIRLKL